MLRVLIAEVPELHPVWRACLAGHELAFASDVRRAARIAQSALHGGLERVGHDIERVLEWSVRRRARSGNQ